MRIFRVNAFTDQPLEGNPAAVVPDAAGLTSDEMQAITRELGGVDTAFILPADAADHDLRLRFFTPRSEAGFIGHATIAAHAVLEAMGMPPMPRQQQRPGLVDIERIEDSGERLYAFSQPPPTIHGALAPEQTAAALNALGLREADLDPGLPTVVAGTGSTRLLVALRAGVVLARLKPDLPALAALSAGGAPAGFFLYTLAPALPGCDTEARMFCPAIGIPEDPVSGNAHAMLACRLFLAGRWPRAGRPLEFTGRQGHHLGRPGVLQVRMELEGSIVQRVRVAGRATIVMEADLELP